MSAQHTPGPWNAVFYDRTAATEIWAGDTLIADVHSHVTTDNANADAILIAAIPELLAAAKRLQARGFFTPVSCTDEETLEDMAAMCAAIAKASKSLLDVDQAGCNGTQEKP